MSLLSFLFGESKPKPTKDALYLIKSNLKNARGNSSADAQAAMLLSDNSYLTMEHYAEPDIVCCNPNPYLLQAYMLAKYAEVVLNSKAATDPTYAENTASLLIDLSSKSLLQVVLKEGIDEGDQSAIKLADFAHSTIEKVSEQTGSRAFNDFENLTPMIPQIGDWTPVTNEIRERTIATIVGTAKELDVDIETFGFELDKFGEETIEVKFAELMATRAKNYVASATEGFDSLFSPALSSFAQLAHFYYLVTTQVSSDDKRDASLAEFFRAVAKRSFRELEGEVKANRIILFGNDRVMFNCGLSIQSV